MLINEEYNTEIKKTTSNSQNRNNKEEFSDFESIDYRKLFTRIHLIEFEEKKTQTYCISAVLRKCRSEESKWLHSKITIFFTCRLACIKFFRI